MTKTSSAIHAGFTQRWSSGRMRNPSAQNDALPGTNHVSQPTNEFEPATKLFNGLPKIGAGVYDGMSALIAAKWKFEFLWVSSFSCSAASGLPDVGIIGPDEILATVRTIRRLTQLPIVVDLDAGYGDPLKVFHVVEAMVRAGAAAVCIEDNPVSKRCSLYPGHRRELA